MPSGRLSTLAKLARDLFRQVAERLEPDERRRSESVAAKQRGFESLILSTPKRPVSRCPTLPSNPA